MEFPLRWATWRFTTRLRSEMRLSHHPGSRLAGAIGRALREAHCTREIGDFGLPLCPPDQPACGSWPLCVYGELIRTQTLKTGQNRMDVPRPMIVCLLDGGREGYRAGELFGFDITLIGDAIVHFPTLRAAIESVGNIGVGDDYRDGCGRFQIEGVRALAGSRGAPPGTGEAAHPIAWDAVLERAAGLRGRALRLQFVSPLRLLQSGTGRKNAPPLLIEQFDFLPFWLALSRRLKDLAYFHGDGPAQRRFSKRTRFGWWGAICAGGARRDILALRSVK